VRRVMEECRRTLDTQAGMAPSPETDALYRALTTD
jgi:hypothetical protein